MIRLLIVDDHTLIREGFKKIIDREVDMNVTGEAASAESALDLLKDNEYDIMVLDISLPGKSGLDLMQQIENLQPKLKILILSMHPEDGFAVRAIRASASGYLTKESAPDELVNAIRKIYQGGKYVSPVLAEKLASAVSKSADKMPHEKLSDREFEVFRLIAQGKSMNEITTILNISLSTANTYRKRIMDKMDIKTLAELIHYAVKNDLIE